MQVLSQTQWQSHRLLKLAAFNESREAIPFLTLLPAQASEPFPCLIALHGYTSSKEEWFEMDAYTKGGNLVKLLADNGVAIIAPDLYGHGENQTSPSLDYDTLANQAWEEFFHGSRTLITTILNDYVKSETFDQKRIGFLSYSMGGLFGFWLANRGVNFKAMVMCAPPVDRTEADEYAPYNNLHHLQSVPLLHLVGEQDEYTSLEDSQWLFQQLPMADKRFVSFASGHSLPLDYVPIAAEWIKQRL